MVDLDQPKCPDEGADRDKAYFRPISEVVFCSIHHVNS